MLASCAATVDYQPLTADVAALPADAFARVRAALEVSYPELEVAEERRFRLQSAWIPLQRRDRPGERRATVYLDRNTATLAVVVETRWLGLDLLGVPQWSSARGDPALERALLGALLAALDA
ncbi:MAG: hypothetical protein AAF628_10835 [Planctomycetota bacterium]